MKFKEYLLENKQEDIIKANKIFQDFYRKFKGKEKKIRQAILDNIVNSKYQHFSNEFIDMVWSVFKLKFTS